MLRLRRLSDAPFLAQRLRQETAPEIEKTGFEYVGLKNCEVLSNTGNSVLVVGTNIEGQRCVAKFQSLITNSGCDHIEASIVTAAAYLDPTIALPVFDVIPLGWNPIDPEDFGWVYTMPYCEGGSLRDHMNFGFSSAGEKVATLAIVATCIAVMHKRGIVHSDIKPSNLLYWLNPRDRSVTDDASETEFQLVVSDYGEATELGSTDRRRIRRGTAPYCAPESATLGQMQSAEDVWAWATIGLEMFLSTHQFDMVRSGAGEHDILKWLGQNDCPPFLTTLILAGHAQDPERRPTSFHITRVLFENVLRRDSTDQVCGHPSALTCINNALFLALSTLGIVGVQFRLRIGLMDLLRTCDTLLAAGRSTASATALRLLRARMGVGEDSLPEQLIRRPNDGCFEIVTSDEGVVEFPIPRDQVVDATWMYIRALLDVVQGTAQPDDLRELSRLAIELRSPGFPTPADHVDLIAAALVVTGAPRMAIQWIETQKNEHTRNWPAVLSAAYLAISEYRLALKFKVVAVQNALAAREVGMFGQLSELMILTCLLDKSISDARETLLGFLSNSEELQVLCGRIALTDLAGWYLSNPTDLPERLADLIFSSTFITSDASVPKTWLIVACLVRANNGQRARKMARAALKDPRTKLAMHSAFRTDLEEHAYDQSSYAPSLDLDPSPAVTLTQARSDKSAGRHEDAMQTYRQLLADPYLPMGDRVACSFELAGILDQLGHNHEELKVYEAFFEDTFPQDWDGEEEGVIKLAVNELVTHKQNWSFENVVERFSVFERLLRASVKANYPEPYCQLLWHTAHALYELGRYDESNTLCDRIHAIFLESSREDLRRLARNALLYKGSTLSQIQRAEDENLVYVEYVNRFGNPADADEALQLMRVWYYIAVFTTRSDRLKALHAFAAFDQVAHRFPSIPDEELGELLIQTNPLREGLLKAGAVPDQYRYMIRGGSAPPGAFDSTDVSPNNSLEQLGSKLWSRVMGWFARH